MERGHWGLGRLLCARELVRICIFAPSVGITRQRVLRITTRHTTRIKRHLATHGYDDDGKLYAQNQGKHKCENHDVNVLWEADMGVPPLDLHIEARRAVFERRLKASGVGQYIQDACASISTQLRNRRALTAASTLPNTKPTGRCCGCLRS